MMGHGGAGLRSVGGGSPRIEVCEYPLIRVCREEERPWREWWAVFGTVTDALEGFGSCGFDAGTGAGAVDEDEAVGICCA